jgi:DNA replication protein DnaC
MSEVCSICGGSGLRVVQEDGRQFARECVCRVERRAARMLERAHIPRRYEHCTLESYDTDLPYSHRSQGMALVTAKKFIEGYPLVTGGRAEAGAEQLQRSGAGDGA